MTLQRMILVPPELWEYRSHSRLSVQKVLIIKDHKLKEMDTGSFASRPVLEN